MSLNYYVRLKQFNTRIWHHFKHKGPISLVQTAGRKIYEVVNPPRAQCVAQIRNQLKGKKGIEIGGPSRVFSKSGLFPIYDICGGLDNCSFSTKTIWQGDLQDGQDFRCGRGHALGREYIRDAVDLSVIPSRSYDFVCTGYVIQHIANPLRALSEWIRVLKEGGIMITIIPHKEKTFDHRRPVTLLAHIVEDFSQGTSEEDMTHIDEVLKLHDLALDPLAGSYEEFKQRTLDNPKKRAVHQHVFDTDLVIRMMNYAGLQICEVELRNPDNIIVVCRKPDDRQTIDNTAFLNRSNSYGFY